MTYFTYCDLKVKNGEMAYLLFQQWERGSIFNIEI